MAMKRCMGFKARLIICFLSLVCMKSFSQIQVLERVVAIVDKDVVLQSELDQRVSVVYAQVHQSGTQAPSPEILSSQVLERLISERLQLNLGFNAGIRITDEELNDAIARVAANAGLSVENYVNASIREGSTPSGLREQIRNEMIIMRVQQSQVNRRIRISLQELDNFLASEEGKFLTSPDVNLGHILLSVPISANRGVADSTLDRALNILGQSRNGTDFRQLAITHSSDQTALDGGDLGWRKLAQLPEVFIKALEQLDVGEVSSPIRSDAGYHLLKLYERRGGGEQLVEQHFVRHILVTPNQIRDSDSTVDLLEKLRARAEDGEEFATLAKEYSEDSGSALSGGELGWSTPGMFVPEFEDIMHSIALNEISIPFRSQFGWHILQVTERRRQDFSQEIMRNKAQNLLRQRKYEEELQVWLQEIRDEAFVEIKSNNPS